MRVSGELSKLLKCKKRALQRGWFGILVGECVVFKGGFGVDSIDSISIVFDFDELTKRFRVDMVVPC
jgi:hypothetical protein